MSPSAAHILVLDDDADVAYAATLLLRSAFKPTVVTAAEDPVGAR